MPSFKTHAIAGAVVGLSVSLFEHQKIKENDPNASIDLRKMFINIVAGIAGAILPDKLEPAFHPNHRSIFHSVTAGGGVALTLKMLNIHSDLKYPVYAFLWGYGSHLVLDARTPKSLLLIS